MRCVSVSLALETEEGMAEQSSVRCVVENSFIGRGCKYNRTKYTGQARPLTLKLFKDLADGERRYKIISKT